MLLNPLPPVKVTQTAESDRSSESSSAEDPLSDEEEIKNESEETNVKEMKMLPPTNVDISKEVTKSSTIDVTEATAKCEGVTRERKPAVFIGLERDAAVQVPVDAQRNIVCNWCN